MVFDDFTLQLARIYMGVDFGRADIFVPQHALDNAEVGTILEQMGGKGMAEGVGADDLGDSRFVRQFLHDVKHHDAREVRASVRTGKKVIFIARLHVNLHALWHIEFYLVNG